MRLYQKIMIIGNVICVILILITGLILLTKNNDDPNQNPIVDISGTFYSGYVGSPHHFNGIAYDPDGVIILYEWDFNGDGVFDWNSTMNGNTSFEYSTSGDYNATFRATDDTGNMAIGHKIIEIIICLEPEPEFDFVINDKFYNRTSSRYEFSGTVNISGYVIFYFNDDIIFASISFDNKNWYEITLNNISNDEEFNQIDWNYTFHSNEYPNGRYKLDWEIETRDHGTFSITIEDIYIEN
jgi:PKD domain-containing protein